MIASTKVQANGFQRGICEFFGKIHGNLPRIYYFLFSCFCSDKILWNIKEFAETVLKLLKDEQLREGMSRETREISQGYDWDNVAKRELELIENLVAEEEHGTSKIA